MVFELEPPLTTTTATFTSAPPPKPPPLPQTHTLTKRPLLHPPIPPVQAKRSPQTIYISSRTPFISAVKRVRKILSVQNPSKQSTASSSLDNAANEQHRRQRNYRQTHHRTRGRGGRDNRAGRQGGAADGQKGEPIGPGVLLKATGKAINKCLSLGVYFMKDDKVTVRVGTGSIDTVDDVVRKFEATVVPSVQQQKKRGGINSFDKNKNNEPSIVNINPHITTTTSTKKRKSTSDPANPSHAGKRPKTGEHTHTSVEQPPSSLPSQMDLDQEPSSLSSIPNAPPPSQPQQQGSQVGIITTSATPVDRSMLDADAASNQSEDDEDEDDDDDSDDDDDEEYTRARKISVIEIKINLVRI